MGKIYERIDARLAAWIGRQRLFFVATAPGEGGHVNVSPKGPIGSLRVVDETTVEYYDHVGSGAETIAHLRDNGRICVMFCVRGPAIGGSMGTARSCRRPIRATACAGRSASASIASRTPAATGCR
jgi:hypothetical protein